MPQPLTIQEGQKFGRLVVVCEVEKKGKARRFLCRCDCGNLKKVTLTALRSGKTSSCGCLQRESRIGRNVTHGETRTRLYIVWGSMKSRCNYKGSHIYSYYGGRGIRVCEDWLTYEAFRDWAMRSGYRDDLTIERKDVDGDYTPDNCTWIPKSQQTSNTRKTLWVTYRGQTKNLKDWSKTLEMQYLVLYKRIYVRGWSVEESFETPALKNQYGRHAAHG